MSANKTYVKEWLMCHIPTCDMSACQVAQWTATQYNPFPQSRIPTFFVSLQSLFLFIAVIF